ncbi:MAG: Eco57I restriction-modification methylase domain-containing protein [Candidatus Thorarchaeota archaeon]
MKSSKKKVSFGIFYTPILLAKFVVWSAFQQFFEKKLPSNLWLELFRQNFTSNFFKEPLTQSLREQISTHIKGIKILDLGVGDGAFLVAAGKFLEAVHPNLDSTELPEFKLEILQKNLHGVDNNPEAIHSSRINILNWITEGQECYELKKSVEGALKQKIRLGNVLLGNVVPNTRYSDLMNDEMRVFHWYKEFPDIFNDNRVGFDLILCNPPYVTKDISREDNYLYRRMYRKQLFVNRLNLYHLFFVRVYDLLTPNGMTVFLTSNSILTDKYSQRVRIFLNTHFIIEKIVDFVSRSKIFSNVLQGTCILVMRKKNGIQEHKTRIIRTFDMKSLIQDDFINEYIPFSKLFQIKKIIPSPYQRTFEILNYLHKNSVQLKDTFRVQSGEIRPADKKIRPYYYKNVKPSNLKSSNLNIVLNGKNVSPYIINLKESRQKPRWYKKPKKAEDQLFREKHASIPRIVFQRITAREQLRRIIAGNISKQDLKANKQIWVENNVNYISLTPDFPTNWLVSVEALLGIFNSLLINWYIHQINLTAAVPPSDLGCFPLPRKNAEIHNKLKILHQKVLLITQYLQTCSSSSEILKHLCPFCTISGKFNQLQSEIDNLVFELYEIPIIYQQEIKKQLSQHHQYFNHH